MRLLSESITHLEDLPLDKFIGAVRSLGKMQATEKADGAQLWFGIDDGGRFYTSREGKKGGPRFYSLADYRPISAFNQFRAAHAALEARLPDIQKVMQPGQAVEVEVIYGRQPNTVTYGHGNKSFIVLLRPVDGTPEAVVQQLGMVLDNSDVSAKFEEVDSPDGEKLEKRQADVTFRFVPVQHVDTSSLAELDTEKVLADLDRFLDKKAKGDITNRQLLSQPITTFPQEQRDELKRIRSSALAKVQTDFKLKIKKELLDKFVSKVKPKLGAEDASADEDVGIEGVVFRDQLTGNMLKVVDKDTFTTINQFNQAPRASVLSPLRTTDEDAPLESRGGLVGQLRIRLAALLGNKDLAKRSSAKKILAGVKGETPEDTVRNLTKNLNIADFQAIKRKALLAIAGTNDELKAALASFKEHKDDYKLELKDGRVIRLTPETVKKTLNSFAEGRQELQQTFDKVKDAKNAAQLVGLLYGALAISLHEDPAAVNEQLLQEKKDRLNREDFKGKDGFTVLNTYLATLLVSALAYKVNDKQTIRLLRDKPHYRLGTWNKDMSLVNHWGYAVWRSSRKDLQKDLGRKTAQELFKWTRHIPPTWWKFIHMDLSHGRDVPIEWEDHRKTLKLLLQYSTLNTVRLNSLLDGVMRYETLTLDQKISVVEKLYFYAQRFIPSSQLFLRLRDMVSNVTLNASGQGEQLMELKLLRKVMEDEGAATAGATTSGSIASVPGADNRRIIKRKRNPDLNFKRFKRPTP